MKRIPSRSRAERDPHPCGGNAAAIAIVVLGPFPFPNGMFALHSHDAISPQHPQNLIRINLEIRGKKPIDRGG